MENIKDGLDFRYKDLRPLYGHKRNPLVSKKIMDEDVKKGLKIRVHVT